MKKLLPVIILLLYMASATAQIKPDTTITSTDTLISVFSVKTRFDTLVTITFDTTKTVVVKKIIIKPPIDTSQRKNLLYRWTFEGTSPFVNLVQDGCCPYSIQQSGIAYNSKNSARFQLNKTDVNKDRKRSEVNIPTNKAEPPGKIERWYGSAFLYDSTTKPDKSPFMPIQWHQYDGTASPPLGLWVQSGVWKVSLNGIAQTDYLGSAQDGKWHSFVFHVIWSENKDGLIEIWKDGEKVFTRMNIATNYKGQSRGVYLKVGVYDWEWYSAPKNSTSTKRVIYIDNVAVGNEKATYKDVVP